MRPAAIRWLVVALAVIGASLAAAGILVLRPGGLPAMQLVDSDDPYVRLDQEIGTEFGMRNPVVWVIEAREGTIWTSSVLERIQALTRGAFTVPGIIAPTLMSLASPNLRDLRVTEGMLEPVYLMGSVPATPDAMAVLRRRVEGDPNYHGTLVSTDGRAAMVVADFQPGADAALVAREALALRDRIRDEEVNVFVVGGPVLRALLPSALRPAVPVAILTGTGVLVMLSASLGVRLGLAVLLSMLLCGLWTAAALLTLGAAVLPWAGFGLVPTMLLGAIVTASGGARDRRWAVTLAGALVAGFAALAVVVGRPAAWFGVAGAVGVVSAMLAAPAAWMLAVAREDPVRRARWLRVGAGAAVVVALAGIPQLRTSFSIFGYGQRYVPGEGAGNIEALAHHFPPPTTLAIRARGTPGFVNAPAVLNALDAAASVAREDPAVTRVLSLADIVKLVNRAFHENRDDFLRLPEDQSEITRYLVLGYSPGFRQFVDRAFARTAMWIYLKTDRSADLSRVLGRVEAQLAAQPIPGAEVDIAGGDGAVILVMTDTARRLALGGFVFLAMTGTVLGATRGWRAATRAVAGGGAATVVAAGFLGWTGVPIDLLSLICVLSAGVVGAACGALGELPGSVRLVGLGLGVGAVGVVALAAPSAAARVVGALLLGVGTAGALAPVTGRPRGATVGDGTDEREHTTRDRDRRPCPSEPRRT